MDATHHQLLDALRAAGCVFPEQELAFVLRHAIGPDVATAVGRRALGLPLELAVGRAEFAGVTVEVGEQVFVPRRRAAPLVDAACRVARENSTIVDLGCGSGAIAAAVRSRLPGARVVATDVSRSAVDLARRNATHFGFEVLRGDWWAALPEELAGTIDVAVSYAPHVPTNEIERIHSDFRNHDRPASVDGGSDGLDHVRTISRDLDRWLAPGGFFVTLVSAEQALLLAGEQHPTATGDVVVSLSTPRDSMDPCPSSRSMP